MFSIRKAGVILILIMGVASLLAMVPPHPDYIQVPSGWEATRIEIKDDPAHGGLTRPKTIPNDILVLRVQFSDVGFQASSAYPDSLVHDDAFFERWMLHLVDFFADASHQRYLLDYLLYPTVFTLPRPMAYYGNDTAEATDEKVAEMLTDLLALADAQIDFSQYGGVIIFHAGAGQESDISGLNPQQIWSTFLTRKALQAAFDPENDDYPGLATNDGTLLTNIVIVPESEFQDYFPLPPHPDAAGYLFSIYGVLTHQFGHLIGLPTLFDNDSSDGRSQGIGNWGLMGTGVWNASGYVPAQLCAWSRCFLGWEDVVNVTEDSTGLLVDHFLDHFPWRNRVYKVPISNTEYFLVENRQQNPDGSLDPLSYEPSYTFKLLEDGEQDYYPDNPDTLEDESLIPYFNFMENRYAGCEWDFFLPGLGGPYPPNSALLVDGSGLLIWHIDENIIAQNFTANFDFNRVNANALHKGIDLEEADGTQHLDTATANTWKYGSPYDSFRAGNNDYFGNRFHNGYLSLPTAESYYGGLPLEIYDIGSSGLQMSFSVRFGWKLDADYEGENPINACIVDLDGDGDSEIFYPMPDGKLCLWENEYMVEGYPQFKMPVVKNYVFDGSDLYLPMQQDDLSRLYRLGSGGGTYLETFLGWGWASHPLLAGEKLYLPMSNIASGNGALYSHDIGTGAGEQVCEFDYPLVANPVYFRDHLYLLGRQSDQSYRLWDKELSLGEEHVRAWELPVDSTLVAVFKADLLPQSDQGEFIVQFSNSVYVYDDDLQPVDHFPFSHDMNTTAPLTLADIDRNGSLDIIFGSDQGIAVVDYSGTLISPPSLMLAASDSLGFNSGVLALDLDHDGRKELIGAFSNNRLLAWDDNFKALAGFPVSFPEPSRNLPLIGKASDEKVYVWAATDNGSIYRTELPHAELSDLENSWITEYGNLQRHASMDLTGQQNQYETDELFVPGEVYIYPNPLKSIYGNKLTLNLMTSRDTEFELKIFDIKGRLVYKQKAQARAYLRNRQLIDFPVDKLASGVYIAVVCADTKSKRIKFAIEK